MARQVERARLGEVDYLAVCVADGPPVALGGVDFRVREGAGTLWQLVVHPRLRSRGIGTRLIGAAERRVGARGLRRAELAVEEGNPRARALYERRGYVAFDRRPDAWDVRGPDGSLRRHETVCVPLGKELR